MVQNDFVVQCTSKHILSHEICSQLFSVLWAIRQKTTLNTHFKDAFALWSFCHQNKFIVCANIPGNKADSDSDSKVSS